VGVRFVFLYFFYIINITLTHNTLLTLTVRRAYGRKGAKGTDSKTNRQGGGREGGGGLNPLILGVLSPSSGTL
jgi:hypothetical protein